ncbi:MAG: hypothetical protein EPO21_18055 [Chloroflexota bacterium]|nr:MAG: hypothetical protein EPO21_18055 [Chloroflexota bacterium]
MKLENRLWRLEDKRERTEDAAIRTLADDELTAIVETPGSPKAETAAARYYRLAKEYYDAAQPTLAEVRKVVRGGIRR